MAMTRREWMVGAMGAAFLGAGSADAGTMQVCGPAFGSSWRASVDEALDLGKVQRIVQGIVAEVDGCFSPYLPNSRLSRLNASRSSKWQLVHPMLSHVTHAALEAARLTRGYFDPAVGPLVARQGFGPISGRAASYASFDVQEGRIRKHTSGATLDLCGIAKGFALDRIVESLQDAGVRRGIVDVGGEVKSIGTHPDGRHWTVAIADPKLPGTARHIIAPHELALATSGHATNGVQGRVSASHIIDPHRQSAANQSLRSVSVLHPSAMWADAMATAFCAAGPEAGLELASRLDVSALFIHDDAEHMTGGFETHVLI